MIARAPAALLLLASVGLARGVPAPVYPLVDEMGLLDPAAADEVRRICVELERETGSELGVLIVESTQGEVPREFGLRVFNTWGIGKRGVNNGLFLLFAMKERRVELLVGMAWESSFSEGVSTALLQSTVVPRMKAGAPAEAVVAGARAVADRARAAQVGATLAPGQVQVEAFSGGASQPRVEPPPPAPTPPPPGYRTGAPWIVRGLVIVLLVAWAVGLAFALKVTFSTGRLVLAKGLLGLIAIAVPVVLLALLAWSSAEGIGGMEGTDWGMGGGGGVGSLVFLGVIGHICHRCNKWMTIHSRTLVSPTYSSSGTGERTYDCKSCGYHKVETYRIPQLTRSSSSSSGSRSSFGGGSSRGGGGGASW